MRVNGKTRTAAAAPPGPAFARLGEATGAPLHEAVKRRVSEAILVGEWSPGTVLPSEVALAAMFGVAVGTVRRALGYIRPYRLRVVAALACVCVQTVVSLAPFVIVRRKP